jgi:hypothetical protein
MDSDNERKKAYPEAINYSIQAMNESAQFSIAIAVGIFGILGIFVSLDTHECLRSGDDDLLKKALWTQPIWIRATGVVLSVAYWALVLFGIQSYLTRRLFEGIVGHYQKRMNEEWYYDDIRKVADEKKIVGWMVKSIWATNYEKKDRYKGLYPVLVSYLGVAFFL